MSKSPTGRGTDPLDHLRLQCNEGNVVSASVAKEAIGFVDAKLKEAETTLAACELARLREVNARLDEQNELRAKLSAAEARIGRLRRLALAHESPKRRGPSGGGTDYRLEEINRARVDCREHNDLTPPTADNNAAQPQKD